MSWGALGNALIGGHQAFRQAVAEREDQARREAYERRLEEEAAFRRERARVDDQRYADTLARQQEQDTIDADQRERVNTLQAYEVAQPFGGDVTDIAGKLRGYGLGGALEDRAVVSSGVGQGASMQSIAGAPGTMSTGDLRTFARLTPEQEAAREAQRLALDTKRREERRQAGWESLSKQLDWGNPSRALGQLTGQAGSIEEAAKLLGLADDLRTNEAQRGYIRANTNLANARAGDPDYTTAGGGRGAASKLSIGASVTQDPAFAQLVDTYYREMGGLIDNALAIYGKGAVLANPGGGPDFMKQYFGQAQAGQTEALNNAIAKAAQAYQAQGRPLPADVAARAAATPATPTTGAPGRSYRQKFAAAPVAPPPPTNNPY